jgi:hypothetical protein
MPHTLARTSLDYTQPATDDTALDTILSNQQQKRRSYSTPLLLRKTLIHVNQLLSIEGHAVA